MSIDFTALVRAASALVAARTLTRAGCRTETLTALTPEQGTLADLGGAFASRYQELRASTHTAAALNGAAGAGATGAAAATVTAATHPLLADAAALDQALGQSALGILAADLSSEQLVAARQDLSQAERLAAMGDHAGAEARAGAARTELLRAAGDAFERVHRAHNGEMADDVSSALSSLGFQPAAAADGAGRHALWAGAGDRQVAAVVGGEGALEMDFQGFDGTDCVATQQALMAALRERGWEVTPVDAVVHERYGGGAMITAAARAAREAQCPPELGLLAASDDAAPADEAPAEDGETRLGRLMALGVAQGARLRAG